MKCMAMPGTAETKKQDQPIHLPNFVANRTPTIGGPLTIKAAYDVGLLPVDCPTFKYRGEMRVNREVGFQDLLSQIPESPLRPVL